MNKLVKLRGHDRTIMTVTSRVDKLRFDDPILKYKLRNVQKCMLIMYTVYVLTKTTLIMVPSILYYNLIFIIYNLLCTHSCRGRRLRALYETHPYIMYLCFHG